MYLEIIYETLLVRQHLQKC